MDAAPRGEKLRQIALNEGWTIHPPLSEARLNDIETKRGISIPDPYRTFLLTVASGLDTDCMQLCPFEESLTELEGPITTQFPYTKAYGDALIGALESGRPLSEIADDPAFAAGQFHGVPPGCLIIGELDGARSVLVVTGEERGHIWQIGDLDMPETRHRHAGDGDHRRLNFEGWFACWLVENGVKL